MTDLDQIAASHGFCGIVSRATSPYIATPRSTMPSNQAAATTHSPTQSGYENYLVLALDALGSYQWVMTSAESEEDALKLASSALPSQGGCEPVAAHTAAELRALADTLSTRTLQPGRSYNLSMEMTDTEVSEQNEEEDEEESPAVGATLASHVTRPNSSAEDLEPF